MCTSTCLFNYAKLFSYNIHWTAEFDLIPVIFDGFIFRRNFVEWKNPILCPIGCLVNMSVIVSGSGMEWFVMTQSTFFTNNFSLPFLLLRSTGLGFYEISNKKLACKNPSWILQCLFLLGCFFVLYVLFGIG